MTGQAERKYALTKLAAGDYLLPSNDGTTLWRVRIYEDGPSHGMEIPADRDFWGIWKWAEAIEPGSYVDTKDWSRWEFFEGTHDTRKQAIDAALKLTGAEQ